MGVYVKFPDGSMHWDESKADPNPNGGSVLDAGSGKAIPGANRQSGPTGPGGNGPIGSQANPNGDYHGNVPVGGGIYGSGGFTGGTSGVAPLGQPGDYSATPFADWLTQYSASQLGQQPGTPGTTPVAQAASSAATDSNPWYPAWQVRQAQDTQQQRLAAAMTINAPGYYSLDNPAQRGY